MALTKEQYSLRVKKIWRIKKLNPKIGVTEIAERCKMDTRDVSKILRREYRQWFLDEWTDWVHEELIKRNQKKE